MSTELRCQFCTFINTPGNRICEACGRSLNLPSINLNPSGIECTSCTYDNPLGSINCAVCETILSQNPSEAPIAELSTNLCQICISNMDIEFKMPGCRHIFCRTCAKQYFTIKIMECGINTFRCPIDVCGSFDELQNKAKFFKDLKTALRGVLDEKTSNVFKSKVAILDIMDKPGFVRCPWCNHGFIHQAKSKMVLCTGCKETFCSKCSQKWKVGHSQINCTSNTTNKDEYLMFTNATCPQCKYKYFLERGGCMHITCSQCSYEYCEFCFKKITAKGKRCDYPNCSKGNSLHGHHPRNCMYYVQEMDHTKLEQLLQKNEIRYIVKASQNPKASKCRIKVNVLVGDNWVDSECKKPATSSHNNMCLNHYKWHLGELMKKHEIDPVYVMNNLECYCELKRNNITTLKTLASYDKPIEDNNTPYLRSLVRSQIPYEKILQ